MKKFNFFEKLWEHGRTLRRVGLVLVMCLIAIPQMWAANTYFTPGETIFIIADGNGAWGDDACVKAAYSTVTSSQASNIASEESTTWLWDGSFGGASGKKCFYTIVPDRGDLKSACLERYPSTCTGARWNWNGSWVKNSDRSNDAYNTFYSTGMGNSNFGWKNATYSLELYGSTNGWASAIGTLVDRGNGVFAYSFIHTATATSYEFKIKDNQDNWHGSNVTLSGLTIDTKYIITATVDLKSGIGSLAMSTGGYETHEPGVYEKAADSGGYGQSLKTVGGRDYEVYSFASTASNVNYIWAGTTTTTYSDKHCLLQFGTTTEVARGWLSNYVYGRGSTYSNLTATGTEFNGMGATGAYQMNFHENNSKLTLVVSGYDQFAIWGKDNNTTTYHFVVTIDGTSKSMTYSTASSGTRRAFDISTGEHIIEISATGASSSSTLWGFSLRLPADECEATAPGALSKGTLSGCSRTITASGSAATNNTWYWQSSASGTDKSDAYSSGKAITETGTYYLRSYCSTGSGCWSDAVSIEITAADMTPAAPTNFTAGSISATGATFTITDAGNASSYDIYYSTSSTAPTSDVTTTSTSKSKAVTGLTFNTTYYAWVRAVCGSYKSSWVALNPGGASHTFATLNTAPASPAVNPSNGWIYVPGESITLTASATASTINSSTTYTWYKGSTLVAAKAAGAKQASATAASGGNTYTIASCVGADAGKYWCEISNGSGYEAQASYEIKIFYFNLFDNNHDAIDNYVFTSIDRTTNYKISVTLELENTNYTYYFKVSDGISTWYGKDDYTITGSTNWCDGLSSSGANVGLTSSFADDYTIDYYYNSNNVVVTYPVHNQAANKVVYFDNTLTEMDNMYIRIGHDANSSASSAFTLVPGTANLYRVKTIAWSDFHAWSIADNTGWIGSNTIYQPWYDSEAKVNKPNDSYAITKQTDYQRYVVDDTISIIPTDEDNEEYGCQYYTVGKVSKMKTQTVTISSYSNGTITVNYTDTGNVARSFTSGSKTLAHTVILTSITAEPATGYTIDDPLTIDGDTYAANHVVLDATTISASFKPATYTVTLNTNSGTINAGNVTSYTYLTGATLPTNVTRDGYRFMGWYATNDFSTDRVYTIGTSEYGNKEYWAKWAQLYTITNAEPANGTITVVASAIAGETVSISAAANTGYDFSAWNIFKTGTPATTIDPASSSASTNFTMPAYGVTVDASFALKTYDVTTTLNNVTKASGTTGTGAATHGTEYSATFTADAGYVLPSDVTVTIGGAAQTKGTGYSWSVSSGTGTFTVSSAKVTGDITLTITATRDASSLKTLCRFKVKSGVSNGDYKSTGLFYQNIGDTIEAFMGGTLQMYNKNGSNLQINSNAIKFNDDVSKAYVRMNLDTRVAAGDLILANVSGKAVAVHTAASATTTLSLPVTPSKAPSKYATYVPTGNGIINQASLYLFRSASGTLISELEIVRPLFYMEMSNSVSSTNLANNDAITTSNYLTYLAGGTATAGCSSTGELAIDLNSSLGYIKFANNNGYVKIVLDNALKKGDIIAFADERSSYQISFTTSTTRATTYSTSSNVYQITSDSDPLINQKTFYVWRASGNTTYIKKMWIYRPSYEVQYDGNGETSGSVAKGAGTSVTIASNGFTKTDYRFVEWNTKADGNGTSYDPSDVVTKDLLLYAIWEEDCTPITPSLSYSATTIYAYGGKPGTATPTVTGNTGSGTVTYTSSNTDAVTVNASTGVITAVGPGTATITATIAKTGDYCGGTATRDITVPALVQQTINVATSSTGVAWGTPPDMTFPGDPTSTLTKNANIANMGYTFNTSTTSSENRDGRYMTAKFTGIPSSTSMDEEKYLSLSFTTGTQAVELRDVIVPIQPVSKSVSAIATLSDGTTTITSSEVSDIPSGKIKDAKFTFTPTVFAKEKTITLKVFIYDQETDEGFRLANPILINGSVLRHKLTYDGNTATSGSVTDSYYYAHGGYVLVSSNAGGYAKTGGYEFNGWNTKADGTGDEYDSYDYENDHFYITQDTTLYAQWRIVVNSNTSNLTAYEDPAHKDVRVTNGATLTLTQDTTVRNMLVETGSTLNINTTNGDGTGDGITLTANSLALKGGWNDDKSKYDMPRVYIDPASKITREEKDINFDIAVDNNNFYPIAVPFDVSMSDVTYKNSVLAASAASRYGTVYAVKTYNGANRANGTSPTWSLVGKDKTLKPGHGYVLCAVPAVVWGEETAVIKFPMKNVPDAALAAGELGSYSTTIKDTVNLTAYWKDGDTDGSKTSPSNTGWNLISVPYMSCYTTSTDMTSGSYVEDPATIISGRINFDNGKWISDGIQYVTVPKYDFSEYTQAKISDDDTITTLLPGWCFFVQVAETGNLRFLSASEAVSGTWPIYAPKREQEDMPTYKTGIILTGNGAKDKTNFLISDKYSAAEYEINADLEKMFGENSYTLATYSLSGSIRLAYNALSNAEAANIIPIGYRAPADGDYTFSINPRYADGSAFEHVNLIDYETGIVTDLLMSSYTFTTERTQNDARFALNVVPRQDMPTDIENGASDASDIRKMIINDQLYIILNGKMYDATGKAVK